MGSCLTLQELIQILFNYMPPWFGDENPVLDALLTGFGDVATFIYCSLVYVKMQTRIKTATDEFLDLIAQDFFGSMVQRCPGESDAAYLQTILNNLLAPRVTRQAMYDILLNLTGRAPDIFESFEDGGYYNHAFANHTFAGFSAPYQAWITAYRPIPPILNTSAFANNTAFATADSYYGADLQSTGCVTDALILATIEETKVGGTQMNVTISN